MNTLEVLRELARQPIPDEAFAIAARALVLSATTVSPTPSSPSATLGAAPPHEKPGVLPSGSVRREAPRAPQYVRLTVLDAAGHRTTVSLVQSFHDRAAAKLGGAAKLSERVRALSLQAPLDLANRSGWIQAQIEEQLQAHSSSV
jgi:hypothetical protein